jgi:hypothetical protein
LLSSANGRAGLPDSPALRPGVWRDDILLHAWELALFNGGAPGVDGVTYEQIDTEGLEGWLTAL